MNTSIIHDLAMAVGETITIRASHGPGRMKLAITGILQYSSLQPKGRPPERYRVVEGRAYVEFAVSDVEEFSFADNSVYLRALR